MTKVCSVCGIEKSSADFEAKRIQCRDCRRAKQRENYNRRKSDPEYQEENRKRALAWYQNPENREKRLAEQKDRRRNDDEWREETNTQRRERYHSDEDHRKNILAKQATPEYREKANARKRQRYNDEPDYRKKIIDRNNAQYQNPEFQRKAKARAKARRNDPDLREDILRQSREYYQEHKDAISEQRNERWFTDPKWREEQLNRMRVGYRDNPNRQAQAQARSKEWHSIPENREHRNERNKERYRNDPTHKRKVLDRTIAWQRRRIEELITQQNGRCGWCSEEFSDARLPELDHYIPLAKGGEDSSNNYWTLCRPCNSAKSAKWPWEFAAECPRKWPLGLHLPPVALENGDQL